MMEHNTTTTVQLSEIEVQLLIESIIEDLGTVQKAFKWVNHKIANIKHEILSRGDDFEKEQLKTWEHVFLYFGKHYRSIEAVKRYAK